MLGARDEHPGGMITLEWLLLPGNRKTNLISLISAGKGMGTSVDGDALLGSKRNSFRTNLLAKGVE